MGQVLPDRQYTRDAADQRGVLLSNLFHETPVSRFLLGDHCASVHADARAHAAETADPRGGRLMRSGSREDGKGARAVQTSRYLAPAGCAFAAFQGAATI